MRLFTRLLPAVALSAALATAGCTYPDGSFNAPGTLALGAGAAIAGVAIASANSGPRHYGRSHYGGGYGYQRPYYGRGYGHGGYRRW